MAIGWAQGPPALEALPTAVRSVPCRVPGQPNGANSVATSSPIKLSINCDPRHWFEESARFLTVLAWPEWASDQNRIEEMQEKLCQLAIRRRAERDPEWANRPQRIKPLYVGPDLKSVAMAEKNLRARIAKRAQAARMAIPLLRARLLGAPGRLPGAVKRLSIAEMASLFADQTTETDPKNVEKRVFRPSLPVMHMALALETTPLDWFYDFMWQYHIGVRVLTRAIQLSPYIGLISPHASRGSKVVEIELT